MSFLHLFSSVCLKPSHPLRTQLLLSFGSVAFGCLVAIAIFASTSVMKAGRVVQRSSDALMRNQVKEKLSTSTFVVAEKMTSYMKDSAGAVQILAEAVKDRIVGYPENGWEEDEFLPFIDIITEKPRYPIQMPPVPLDWEIWQNLDGGNLYENLQERSSLNRLFRLSTASGSYFMQGTCDPKESISALSFYPNCTDNNNNIETGGKIFPTETNKGLYSKSSGLTPIFKAIFEFHPEILLTGMFYANSGAGSIFHFPGMVVDSQKMPYRSYGCDWMRNINPNSGEPFGSEEEILKCRPAGTRVQWREYNPLETEWYQRIALNPGKVTWYGPIWENLSDPPFLTVGRAVFDRRTGNLIGCVNVDISLDTVFKGMEMSLLNTDAQMALVKYEDGLLVTDTLGSIKKFQSVDIHVLDTGIVDEETYETLKNAVDFENSNWTFDEVNSAYQSMVISSSTGLITAYPLPIPPKEYDPTYRPIYLALHSVNYSVFDVVDEIERSIQDDVKDMVVLSVIMVVIAMAILLATVWCVSRMLTQPLLWIENVAREIVNHHSDSQPTGEPIAFRMHETFVRISHNSKATVAWTPHTEINDLLASFEQMINGFSGPGASKVAESDLHEIKNELTWHSDFRHLHSISSSKKIVENPNQSSDDGIFQMHNSANMQEQRLYSSEGPPTKLKSLRELSSGPRVVVDSDSDGDSDEKKLPAIPPPRKQNHGRHISLSSTRKIVPIEERLWKQSLRSQLFWWIVVLIVIPLVLISALTCGMTSKRIVEVIPKWIVLAGDESFELQSKFFNVMAQEKAALLSAVVFGPMRDLYLATRMASWLFFGGVKRVGGATLVESLTERCKGYELGTCPVRPTCPCNWNDYYRENDCADFPPKIDTRYFERNMFAVQASDFNPSTGVRRVSSYPLTDFRPESTVWWDNVTQVPGAKKRENASGYATLYDRIVVASAMSVVQQATYNYPTALNDQKQFLGSYIGFEADGMLTGFAGCNDAQAAYSTWQSSERNDAYLINASLCPKGKYGYDSRCRDWYASGRRQFQTVNEAVHVTPPYEFAGNESVIATSATSALANIKTGEYIGQVLFDFKPFEILQALESLGEIISVVITPGLDSSGGDTVVGPNKSAGWKSAAVGDLLFLPDDAAYRVDFYLNVLVDMKNGTMSSRTFERKREDGSTEKLRICYAPVTQRYLFPLSPDTFSRGVNVSETLMYSLGIISTEDYFRMPFFEVEEDLRTQLDQIRAVYIALTVVVSSIFIIFVCIITFYVTEPMILLLHIVKNINKGEFRDDLPPMEGGSREVRRVYNTFSKLYKIVRVSNGAFFSRNLKWAFHFISDALELFRKVDDQKAVGIACNNLGNTFFAMRQNAFVEHESDWILSEAIIHYDEAVTVAEDDFEAVILPCEDKADLALQLSDRLFNRALFLLNAAKEEENSPSRISSRERGYRDLERSKALDCDVKGYWLHKKILLKNSTEYFCRILRRINGLSMLSNDAELKTVWNVEELIEEAEQVLIAAWSEQNAPLFSEVDRVGRVQQLEASSIRFHTNIGDDIAAARLSMRMFVEDEYILEGAFVSAAEALLRLIKAEEEILFSKKTAMNIRVELRRMLKNCKHVTFHIGKCMIFAIELSEHWSGHPLLHKVNENCLKIYDRCCATNDFVAVIPGSDSSHDLSLRGFGTKYENDSKLKLLLDNATLAKTWSASPAFPTAFQMVVDSQICFDYESFFLVIIDGNSWNFSSISSIKSQIERVNRDQNSTIHIFMIGLGVDGEDVKNQCRSLCNVTKSSFYSDATLETIDQVFCAIVTAVSGTATRSLEGITMEKF